MVRPSTAALIERAHRYSASYRAGFANHLPMALAALDAMGASDAQVERHARRHEAHLEPIRDVELARVDAMARRLEAEGTRAVVGDLAPKLCEGIGSAAFHGAIRTAYAVESGSRTELAHALAYWEWVHHALPEAPRPHGTLVPVEVLRAISQDPLRAGRRPPGEGIARRMSNAAREPGFGAHVASLDPRELRLPAIAAGLIRAYCATGDFTLLHGITGSHALRVLAPLLPDLAEATRHAWTAVVAAYVACGSPSPDGWRLKGSDTLDWAEIHARAADCDDEHDIKFAYSCWREWQATGFEDYRRAASATVSAASARRMSNVRATGLKKAERRLLDLRATGLKKAERAR